MPKLVSIVVPAYNRAKMIETALTSIAAQDYSNIEVVIVDDASADDTAGAAEETLRDSGRDFKIIRHETNRGVSAARNTGLKAIAGDYVIFFDSDDIADPDFVSTLLGLVTANDGDAAFCGFRIRNKNTERAVGVCLSPSRRYAADELAVMYMFNQIGTSVCTTIFKTSFLKAAGLEFTEGCRFGEDLEFMVKAFSLCGSINFSPSCHYVYVQHEDQSVGVSPQTKEKDLLRYVVVAEMFCRTARYIAEHAKSPKVRAAAMNYMLADGLVNVMTGAARQRDKTKFYETLYAPETRRALIACLRYIIRKPELVYKAIALLIVPGLYYSIRSKP